MGNLLLLLLLMLSLLLLSIHLVAVVVLVVLFQIVDGNAKTDVSNRREPGMFCGEAEQPQTFISETSYVKVLFHTDNFTDQVSEQYMDVICILLSYVIISYVIKCGLSRYTIVR